MNSKKKAFILIFILLICVSPCVWVGLKNKSSLNLGGIKIYQLVNAPRLYQINTFQGETKNAGLKLVGRLVINKYSWIGKDILSRTLESFDFNFLFFKGDLDISKSTKNSGPILLTLFPLIVYGFIKLNNKKIILILLFVFALFGAISEAHYDIVVRIPFILTLIALASFGGLNLASSSVKNSWKLIYIILILFEFSRFLHDFIYHYPGRLMLGN